MIASGPLLGSLWALVAMSVATVGLYGTKPAFWPLPAEFLSGPAAAGGIALINSVGNLGGFVGPYVLGWLKDATGTYEAGLYFLAGCALASAALAFVSIRRQAPATEAVATGGRPPRPPERVRPGEIAMTARKKTLGELRSQRWFGATDLRSFGHRSRMLQMGYERADFSDKPVIGIINTWSDINPCHQHFRERVEHVKRGVWQAGGFPIELPALSLSENFVKPTTMLYRNLLAMEVEELLRQHPVDGAVLMGGCDKTTPGTVMGGISMNLPMVFLPAGPMMRGHFGGTILGSGSDVWKYWAEKEAGNITTQEWNDMEAGIARSAGTCMTMGTASTMTSITEALGLSLPGAASIPAADADHPRMACACGRRIVEMIWEDLKPSDILDRRSIDNALVVHNALGRLHQRDDPPRRHGGPGRHPGQARPSSTSSPRGCR